MGFSAFFFVAIDVGVIFKQSSACLDGSGLGAKSCGADWFPSVEILVMKRISPVGYLNLDCVIAGFL